MTFSLHSASISRKGLISSVLYFLWLRQAVFKLSVCGLVLSGPGCLRANCQWHQLVQQRHRTHYQNSLAQGENTCPSQSDRTFRSGLYQSSHWICRVSVQKLVFNGRNFDQGLRRWFVPDSYAQMTYLPTHNI